MRLKYDLHTHTTFSDGKGMVEGNVTAGIRAGLKVIGISEHGPDHMGFSAKIRDYKQIWAEIIQVRELYPEIKILLGIEANIVNKSGELKSKKLKNGEDFLESLDYIMAGYHFGAMGSNPFFTLNSLVKNAYEDLSGKVTKKNKNRNTEMVINALYRNNIQVLTHPGAKAEIDIFEVAKACAENDTLMEINNTRHANLSVEAIKIAAQTDALFIIGSDAHQPEDVGTFDRAVDRAKEAGLDPKRIVNLEIEWGERGWI